MATQKNKPTSLTRTSSLCSCINLRRASLAVTNLYDSYLVPSGLNNSQYSLLKHIKGLGPISVSDLALEMRLDRTTIVRNLKAMEQIGYVEDTSAEGSRNRRLTLTESGRTVYIAAEQLWGEAQAFFEASLGHEDLKALTALLSKVEALTS